MSEFIVALRKAGWAPISVFVAHMILWQVVGGYEALPNLDTPMHLLGGLAIAFFLWTFYSACMSTGVFGRPNNLAIALLTFTSTVSSAVFWEFAEYLSDRYLGTTTQKGLEDTLLDILLGIVGGAIFVGVAWFRRIGSDGPAVRASGQT